MIRVIVNGAKGKMGQVACSAIGQDSRFTLVAATSREDNLAAIIQQEEADVVVDLTRADAAFANSMQIINAGACPVIGTSGLQPEEISELKELCSKQSLGGIIVPNFSLSAVLMMRFAAEAARYLAAVEIIEMHHPQKYDAPSGTAMKTADMIADAKEQNEAVAMENELIIGARGGKHRGVSIHSLRLPGVLANQQVIFGNPGETLTLTHNTLDRASFMPGLLLACEKVTQLHTLYYGLEELMFA